MTVRAFCRSTVATAALALFMGACSDGQPAADSSSTTTPASSRFPVVLEHDTRVIASADGSNIREEPVAYQARFSLEGVPSPDQGPRATFHDGKLFLQEGYGEPEVIAEVSSTAEFANIGWSPDGGRLIFDVSFEGASPSIYVVSVEGSGLVDVGEGLAGDSFGEAWSPDSQRVAFGVYAPAQQATSDLASQMYVVNADGSGRTLVGEFVQPQGDSGWDVAAWSPDGSSIAAFSPEGGLRVLDVAGGAPKELGGGNILKWSWSPDSRFLAFDTGFPEARLIQVADVAQPGALRQLTEGEWPRWAPGGERIAFKRGNEVFTIRPDGSGLAALGDLGSNERGGLTWSEDGAELEFVRGTSSVEYSYTIDLRTATATRSPTSLTQNGFSGTGEAIELSPDGTRVAFPVQSGKEHQYTPGWFVMDLVSGDVTQATDDPRGGDIFWTDRTIRLAFSAGGGGVFLAEGDRSPPRHVSDNPAHFAIVWSPDGKYLAMAIAAGIELIDVDGPDDRTLVSGLDQHSETVQRVEWSPDGTALLYEVSHIDAAGTQTWQRFVVDLDGGQPRPLLEDETGLLAPRWSPDGKSMAFTRADETGAELWLVDAGGGNERLLIRFEGAGQSLAVGTASSAGSALWSPDGTKIATVLSGTDLYVVDVETGDATLTAVNASYCLMALLGWSPDSQSVYVVPQCALGGI